MKLLLISPKNRTVYNFRGDLIKSIAEKGYEVIVTGPDRTDVDKIEALGAQFVEIPMNKTGTSILGDLKYCKRLFSLIKHEKPDVTLGYTVKPVIYGAIAARLAGIKNINSMVTGGGYVFTSKSLKARLLGIIVRTLYRIGFSCAKNVIFQNSDDLNEFCEMKLVKREKCHIVNGSGVNMDVFSPKPLPQDISFFMLSRLLKSKGVREYLEAASMVKAKYPDINFYLLGKYEHNMQDGIEADFIEKYIKNGIVERFEETNDVRPYYEMCSVFVLPSYREGTPRTVLEAMAMGRPIISTDANGCRETVLQCKNGFLVPVGDSTELAKAMVTFIEQPELIEQMGKTSVDYCKKKFDVCKINDSMLKILSII